MRDEKGRFVKGHSVSEEWKERIGEKNSENMKGKTAWNKGTIGLCKPNSGSFKDGHAAPQTAFQEGVSPWNKGVEGYNSGEEHWNWQGGITPENRKIRTSTEYKKWRKDVFERDGFTCQLCGIKGGELHADHILQFAYYPESRLDINNGRTLCKPCHLNTDSFSRKLKKETKNSGKEIEIKET